MISDYLQKIKRITKPNKDSEIIQSGFREGIWLWKMRQVYNENRETSHDEKNRTKRIGKIKAFEEKET